MTISRFLLFFFFLSFVCQQSIMAMVPTDNNLGCLLQHYPTFASTMDGMLVPSRQESTQEKPTLTEKINASVCLVGQAMDFLQTASSDRRLHRSISKNINAYCKVILKKIKASPLLYDIFFDKPSQSDLQETHRFLLLMQSLHLQDIFSNLKHLNHVEKAKEIRDSEEFINYINNFPNLKNRAFLRLNTALPINSILFMTLVFDTCKEMVSLIHLLLKDNIDLSILINIENSAKLPALMMNAKNAIIDEIIKTFATNGIFDHNAYLALLAEPSSCIHKKYLPNIPNPYSINEDSLFTGSVLSVAYHLFNNNPDAFHKLLSHIDFSIKSNRKALQKILLQEDSDGKILIHQIFADYRQENNNTQATSLHLDNILQAYETREEILEMLVQCNSAGENSLAVCLKNNNADAVRKILDYFIDRSNNGLQVYPCLKQLFIQSQYLLKMINGRNLPQIKNTLKIAARIDMSEDPIDLIFSEGNYNLLYDAINLSNSNQETIENKVSIINEIFYFIASISPAGVNPETNTPFKQEMIQRVITSQKRILLRACTNDSTILLRKLINQFNPYNQYERTQLQKILCEQRNGDSSLLVEILISEEYKEKIDLISPFFDSHNQNEQALFLQAISQQPA